MKYLQNIENKIINNASKELTEFLISQKTGKTNIFINSSFSKERIEKNLSFINQNLKVLFLEETSFVYNFSSPDVLQNAQKFDNINNMVNHKYDIIIIDYKLLVRKLQPLDFFAERFTIKRGKKISYNTLINALFNCGFVKTENVFEFGEYATRGYIIDIGLLQGFYRVEFDGDVISSITTFNTETQRKNQSGFVDAIEFGNIKDIPEVKFNIQKAKKLAFAMNLDFGTLEEDLQSFYALSLHNFLPLFYEESSSIIDYTPKESIFFYSEDLPEKLLFYKQEVEILYQEYINSRKNIIPPEYLFSF